MATTIFLTTEKVRSADMIAAAVPHMVLCETVARTGYAVRS